MSRPRTNEPFTFNAASGRAKEWRFTITSRRAQKHGEEAPDDVDAYGHGKSLGGEDEQRASVVALRRRGAGGPTRGAQRGNQACARRPPRRVAIPGRRHGRTRSGGNAASANRASALGIWIASGISARPRPPAKARARWQAPERVSATISDPRRGGPCPAAMCSGFPGSEPNRGCSAARGPERQEPRGAGSHVHLSSHQYAPSPSRPAGSEGSPP